MKYCSVEGQDFSETEFEVEGGVLYHVPSDDPQDRHRARSTAAPPPPPGLDLPDADRRDDE